MALTETAQQRGLAGSSIAADKRNPPPEIGLYRGERIIELGEVIRALKQLSISAHGKRVRVTIANPVHAGTNTRHAGLSTHGNHMALANIRERLMLFYDLEADLSVHEQDGRYTVSVELPLRRQEVM